VRWNEVQTEFSCRPCQGVARGNLGVDFFSKTYLPLSFWLKNLPQASLNAMKQDKMGDELIQAGFCWM
jgi:hypothetical protein